MKRYALLFVLALAGCAARTEYVSAPLPLPPRPELPSISGAQLECLSDDTYRAIATRDRQRREYAEQLEVVILATHDNETGTRGSNGSN